MKLDVNVLIVESVKVQFVVTFATWFIFDGTVPAVIV